MKKFIINALITGLQLFESLVVDKLSSQWVRLSAKLSISRLKLFGEALVDSDPNDKAQIEKIAKETLVSAEFSQLHSALTNELASKVKNEQLVKLLVLTESLRMHVLAVLVDDNKDNSAQLKAALEDFMRSEEFDALAISFAELLTDKYAKDPVIKRYLVALVTTLVNSDDQN